MRASGDGIADTNGGCCWIRKRRRLDVFPDQLNFLARKRERRLFGQILRQCFAFSAAAVMSASLAFLGLIKTCQPFPQGKQFALERGDFGFQGLDLSECDHRAGADGETRKVKSANIPPPIPAILRGAVVFGTSRTR